MKEETTEETRVVRAAHPGRTQRAGVLITLIAVVGAVALMDIVAEMVVDLVRAAGRKRLLNRPAIVIRC